MFDVHVLDTETGNFISQEHRRIAEIINDYDSTLQLVWIPPNKRVGETHPFAILHTPEGGEGYIVRKLKESELNEELLIWLWSNDQERNSPLANLEKWEAAQEAMRLKRQMDEMEEQRDVAKTILNSPLNTFKHNGKVYR